MEPALALSQSTSSLRWQAAAGCPDAAAGQKAIDDLLTPRGLGAPWRANVSVTITQLSNARWQAHVVIRDAAGITERRLDGAQCKAVAGAAALVVAMALETTANRGRVASTHSVASPPPPPAPAAAAASAASLGVTLGARAAIDLGSVPLPGMGVGAVLGIQLGKMSLTADATAWLPRLSPGPSSRSGAKIGLLSAALRGCYAVLRVADQLGVEPCAAAELGIARADGVEVLGAAHHQALWAAAFAGLALHQQGASGFDASLAVEVGLPLFRPRYVVTDFGPVFRAAPVVGRVAVGLGWTLR